MDRSVLIAGVFACILLSTPTAALSQVVLSPGGQLPALAESKLRLAQGCARRIGPFVTQDTAWRRWREARGQGYAVSAGVFPCYDRGARGYCFNILYRC